MITPDVLQQLAWLFVVLASTWFCFEGVRLDRTPVRLLGFLAVMIGGWHSFHELQRFGAVLQGYPVDGKIGLEVFFPAAMAVWKYAHIVRLHVIP